MKIFQCGHCAHSIYFENVVCENCGHLSGFRDVDRNMLTFNATNKRLISDREHMEYKFCKNKDYNVCNWVIEKNSPQEFCSACQLNRTIPKLADLDNFENWTHMEIAKHRLIYQLQKIGLPLPNKMNNYKNGLCFDFVSNKNNPRLMTGHSNGVVTILISEGNSVFREQARKDLLEPYRTLVGHLRHEVGHYFWDQLIKDNSNNLANFRAVFGDETLDYGKALDNYYKNGAPENWQKYFISKYATSHAWEDWAETWAHYLHIMDMVETAYFFKISGEPLHTENILNTKVSFDPYQMNDFDKIIETCVPLTFAVNSINRAMGIPDLYPFVISPAIVEKLRFVHHLLLPLRN